MKLRVKEDFLNFILQNFMKRESVSLRDIGKAGMKMATLVDHLSLIKKQYHPLAPTSVLCKLPRRS